MMNVLITNIWLVNQGGTEAYVRDLAIELKGRGHYVEVYSPQLGAFAKEIESADIHVCNNLSELQRKPEIIHAHQFMPCMEVASIFVDVPIIYFVHDYSFPGDSPPKLDQVGKYVAVDDLCLRKLVNDYEIHSSRTTVIRNWVNTDRFRLRTKFSTTAKKALVFSNYANEENYYKVIKETCTKNGIQLDGLGNGFNNSISDPENRLSRYDIVFAKGKAAMEALASGAAVIVCDSRGLGAMVSPENFDFFRQYNFGMFTLNQEIRPDLLEQEINKYDPDTTQEMAARIRNLADFGHTVDQIVTLYQEVLADRAQGTESSSNDLNVRSTYKQTKSATLPQINHLKSVLHHTRLHEKRLVEQVQTLQKKVSQPAVLGKNPPLPTNHVSNISPDPSEEMSRITPDEELYYYIKSDIEVQRIGQNMNSEFGFLGVPVITFAEAGKNQILSLLAQGLSPASRVLEIGCGVLRVGYWLIRYLDANSYFGIEPAESRVQLGIHNLLSPALYKIKHPHFDHNEFFDTAVFNQKFDFFLAGSIWTHCSKKSIIVMLDGFLANSSPTGIFLASYLPATTEEEDYKGDAWVGTSHRSSIAGCIKHKISWIQKKCTERKLHLEELPHEAFDSQIWLKISRPATVAAPSRFRKFLENLRGKN